MPPPPILTRWKHAEPPTAEALQALMRAEGLAPAAWANAPGETYASHEHSHHKVVYCVRGSITFVLVTAERLELRPGDRLDLPAGWPHAALVGPEGVECLEAARNE